ncbi:MAG: energy transducer TonB [Planctomycetota bacterium]|nr:energy transducer TonB [Planctomycetota bacterium]
MHDQSNSSWLARLGRSSLAFVLAIGCTAFFFMVLPLLQAINSPFQGDSVGRAMEVVTVPPPPPPPMEEPDEPEPEPEPEPPQMDSTPEPLDISQLEVMLNPGFGDFLGGDFGVQLKSAMASSEEMNEIFSSSELDQKARRLSVVQPRLTSSLLRQTPATVVLIFIVDENGRVQEPKVQRTTNPAFDRSALAAIRQWKFEPAKAQGRAVSSRLRQSFSFENNN